MPAANRLILALAAFALLASLQDALSATNKTQFDGSWNAVLITRSGQCERSGQATGQILNGALVSPGAGITVSGYVNADGELTGRITAGPYYVAGSGRLAGNSGSGTWQGVGPNGPCAGIWNAKRV